MIPIAPCGLIILETPATIGFIELLNRFQLGFSFVELLVSLLIISSGFVGYTELIARVKFTQLQATERLQAVLLMDYTAENAKINSSICMQSSQCPPYCILPLNRGLFDQSSPLMAGFALSKFYIDKSVSPLGCLDCNHDTGEYLIGVYPAKSNRQLPAVKMVAIISLE